MGDAGTPETSVQSHSKMPLRGWIVIVTLVAAVLILVVLVEMTVEMRRRLT